MNIVLVYTNHNKLFQILRCSTYFSKTDEYLFDSLYVDASSTSCFLVRHFLYYRMVVLSHVVCICRSFLVFRIRRLFLALSVGGRLCWWQYFSRRKFTKSTTSMADTQVFDVVWCFSRFVFLAVFKLRLNVGAYFLCSF